EKYTSTTLSHTHDGLSLSGTSTDAGMLEVTYTTQTLRVYVHQENDQVMGYTGNVLGGDARMGGFIDVDIEHIASNGRAVNFEATDSIDDDAADGVYTFSNVPAAANVIVTADEADYHPTARDEDGDRVANTVHLLDKNGHSDELAAYTDKYANGIRGGAFGEHGGFHHTVELCPLMSGEGNQRHGECGTFAFVETYAVNGQAWKWVRGKTSDDFASANAKSGVKGLTVSMDPVDGENLAEEDESYTEKGNTKVFDFNRMPAGVYKVTTVPESGWIAQRGPLESPTNDLAARLNPLDSALNIDVTPTTGYAYGHVVDGDNRRMAGVTVNVNGVSVETDSNGRYVAEGFRARNGCGTSTARNVICVTTAVEGSEETADRATFAANSPTRINVEIEDAAEVTTISGRVTHSDGGAGVGGVRIWVDGRAPLNKNARTGRTGPNNIYITGGDGSFSVRINAKAGGATATITASRDGMFFSPDAGHTFSAVAGQNISGITFTAFDNGTIHGRVVDASNNAISGVIVTADQVGGDATDADTTGTTGTYSLSVRYGQYGVTAAKHGYTFTDTTGVNVPNDGKALNDLIGTPAEDNADLASLSLSGVTLRRSATLTGFRAGVYSYTAEVSYSTDMTTVSATPSVPGARVTEIYPDDADDASGHQVALGVGTTSIEVTVTAADGESTKTYTVAVTRLDETTTITGTVTDAQSGDAISGVRITPTGGNLLNGGRNAYVSTNASGVYTVIMESGGSTTLTPSKTGYTFEPGNRAVTLNAGTVTGADFSGSEYATITGVVMAGTTAMEGVTVTATSQGITDSDDTDRRGRFSVSVPAGTATVTATKTGYTFASQTVSLEAGESRSLGTVMAEGNMAPLNVEAARDTADTGLFETTVTVEWTPGPGGRATQYQVQIQDTLGMWQDVETAVTAPTADNDPPDADSTWQAQITPPTGGDSSDPEGELSIRVEAQHDHDTDDQTPMQEYASDAVTVDAIDPTADDVAARRNVDAEPDSLVVTWTAEGNTNSQWRVVVSFDSGTTWYVLNDAAGSGESWGATVDNIVGTTPSTATNDGTAGTAKTAAVTAAEVDGALMFRVDARQGTATADNPWKVGPTVSVDAKSTG
ncbi:MAG: carboxypeptidase regulatory-like domain-containing protein, partial [Gemmatimonadetes bacterium]|nr:carboxypeptidase regulatory-like domain-containing protein [Gemmatimonadota bacterium]